MAIFPYNLIQDAAVEAGADVEVCGDDNQAYRAIVRATGSGLKPGANPVVSATLQAIAQGDCLVRDLIPEVKDQMFVSTADVGYLNRLGANVGVQRPAGVGMKDDDYRQLIPVMSYAPKQLRGAIQELLRIWYGDLAARASVTSELPEPFPLADGQTLEFTVNDEEVTLVFEEDDFEDIGAATAREVADVISTRTSASGLPDTNALTFQKHVAIASPTLGAAGAIEITGGTATGAFDFPLGKKTINSATARAVLYEINTGELVVLLPSSPAIVTRGLHGSWRPNEDENGTIQCGYVFDPDAEYSISGVRAETTVDLDVGTVRQNILVDEIPETWPNEPGYFVVDFGLSTEEGPIRYLQTPNSANLIIDPAYVFEFDHAAGATLNLVRSLGPPTVNRDGSSFAAYVTGLAAARQALRDLIVAATAVGVVVRFEVAAPDYRWSNPALDTNEAT